MITMFYKVVLNQYSESYNSYNEGFIIAKYEGDKLIELEGLFTYDYLNCQICKEGVILTYYRLADKAKCLQKDFKMNIEHESFELPLRSKFYISEFFVELLTTEILENQEIIKKCKKQMEEFKSTNLFKTIDLFEE